MLADSAKTGERATGDKGRPSKASTAARLSDIGVSYDQSAKWQQVAALTDGEFEEALSTTQAITHEISTPKVLRTVQGLRREGQ